MREGKVDEARRECSKAVDITHDHAVELMRQCQSIGVDCIVAMYEADSQLAYLNKIGLAEYIISEDSDLILFGAQKILFKLQIDGRCTLFESSKLPQVLGISEEKFNIDKFRRICILSGCDYLDNLPGIGLSKAKKFMLMTEETNMRRALMKIPSYLNMKKLTVSDEYIEGFLRAEATFRHMFVYDPVKREMLRLNELDDETDVEHCCNAGTILEPDTALQIALGNLNPRKLDVCNDFDPDKKHKNFDRSIWRSSREQNTSKKSTSIAKQQKLNTFFSCKSINKKIREVQSIAISENEVTESVELTDLVSSYCFNAMTTTPKPQSNRNSINDDVEIPTTPKAFNPFTKRAPLHDNSSMQVKKVSKYFVVKTENSSSIEIDTDDTTENSEKMSPNSPDNSVSEAEQDYSAKLQLFKRVSKTNFKRDRSSEKMETDSDNDDVEMGTDEHEIPVNSTKVQQTQKPPMSEADMSIDVESYQFTAKSSSQPTLTFKPRIGLSKNYKKPTKLPQQQVTKDSSQTLLSRFGFEKRTSVK